METMFSLAAPYTEFTLIIWCNIISFQAFQHDITANEAIRAFTSITAVKDIMVIQDIIVRAVMTVNSFILFSLSALIFMKLIDFP